MFETYEIGPDQVLASGCLPFMFQTVMIDGGGYWDGGYMANPAIFPLIYGSETNDVVIVHINPLNRDEIPKTAKDILNRLNEISFNSSLMREMRAIAFASHLARMYVDNCPPLTGGREIWGYPMKYGCAKLETVSDTLTGVLIYAGQRVASGTMVYRHGGKIDPAEIEALLNRTQVTLKLIPDIAGSAAIARLVGINFADIVVKGAWRGRAHLDLVPAVNCPLADLPVLEQRGGLHIVTDMTLPYGRVLHDYLAGGDKARPPVGSQERPDVSGAGYISTATK